jgi:hypothetical protein
LGGDDAFGVGNSTSVHELRVLAERNVGRHGVHVRGEDQVRCLTGRAAVDVPASAAAGILVRLRNWGFFDVPTALGEGLCQKIAHCAFVVAGGLDFA